MYHSRYETELVGPLALTSDGNVLLSCRFGDDARGGRHDGLAVFAAARAWLDAYFADERPNPRELALGVAATPFQALVREALLDIPYGQTTTYGTIARRIEAATGLRCAAQAVGGAVGKNPLPIIVPCHRVLGAGGALVGYSGAGGVATKVKLLEFEGVANAAFFA